MATKQDLSALRIELCCEMAAMRGGVAVMERRMTATENRLVAEFHKGAAIIAKAMHEHVRMELFVVEEKYKRLSAEMAKLRQDFEARSRSVRSRKRSAAKRLRRPRSP